MIFGPSLAPNGFMSQVDLLLQNGRNPDEDLAFYIIPGGNNVCKAAQEHGIGSSYSGS